jgi:branched-chain amino acid aminotransferase
VNAASARLPAGAYTTFRTYTGDRVLRLEQHVRRLVESAALLGMDGDLAADAVHVALRQVLRETGYAESRFRLTFAPPRLFISVEPFTPYPPSYYETGVKCVAVTQQRDNPHAKSTAFIASAGGAYKVLPNGIHEGLMVSAEGSVLEGLSSNFFALHDDVLHTEQEHALLGVTQALALEVAYKVAPSLPQSAHAIKLTDLSRTTECFITSVSREIMPVVQIDDIIIGAGIPGFLTRSLIDGLAALIAREAHSVRAKRA